MRVFTLLLLAIPACVQAERPREVEEPFRCDELPSEHAPLAYYLIDDFYPPESFSIHQDFPTEVSRDTLRMVEFTLTNHSGEAIWFAGYGPKNILTDLQHRVASGWEFDWDGSVHCGTGLERHRLQPDQSATLYVFRNAAFDARGTATLVGCSSGKEYRIATPVVPQHVCSSDCPGPGTLRSPRKRSTHSAAPESAALF